MSLHGIEKQYLLGEMLSEDALHLARAIYNTYLENNKDLHMEIKIETVTTLLKIPKNPQNILYIAELFEEINEPIGVKNFNFYGHEYELHFIVFCTYKIEQELIIIDLNEEYLYAEQEYMIDKFLTN